MLAAEMAVGGSIATAGPGDRTSMRFLRPTWLLVYQPASAEAVAARLQVDSAVAVTLQQVAGRLLVARRPPSAAPGPARMETQRQDAGTTHRS